MEVATRDARRAKYEKYSPFPIFLLGSLFLVGLIEAVTTNGDTRTGRGLMVVAWMGFAIDLGIAWWLAPDRRSYPRKHWFAFIAVAIPLFRAVFVFYIFIRLARGRTRLQSKVQYYAAYLTVLVITFGAALVLEAERTYPGSNIHTYGEAIWWASVTVTTVGYGDYTPVSPTGRGIATLMLFNGVAIISVITATISSRFVSDPDKGEVPVTLDRVDERLERMEAAIAALAAQGVRVPVGVEQPEQRNGDSSPPVTPPTAT